MYARILILALLGLLALGIGRLREAAAAEPPQLAALALLPETLGGFGIAGRWKHPLDGGVVEEGARYAGPGGRAALQLDFWRNSRQEHNGIACDVGKGEIALSEQLTELQTRSGPALFDVALLRGARELRLMASTQCKAGGCSEHQLRFGFAPSRGEGLAALRGLRLAFLPTEAAVPVALTVELDHADVAAADTQARLLERLREVAAQLDLAPAQRLAAAAGQDLRAAY